MPAEPGLGTRHEGRMGTFTALLPHLVVCVRRMRAGSGFAPMKRTLLLPLQPILT